MKNKKNHSATLEACISRLKTLAARQDFQQLPLSRLRTIALSATIPNVQDIAQWLNVPANGICVFGPEYRPVPVQIKVISFDDS